GAEGVVVDLRAGRPGGAAVGRGDDVSVEVGAGRRSRGKVGEGDVEIPEERRGNVPINVDGGEGVDASFVLRGRSVVASEGLERAGGDDGRGRPGRAAVGRLREDDGLD